MSYESNDKQELIGAVKVSSFSELRISKIIDENDNFKAIDIRNWYCTQSNPEMKPTPKGVRVRKEDLAEVLTLILKNVHEEIDEQLAEKGLVIDD